MLAPPLISGLILGKLLHPSNNLRGIQGVLKVCIQAYLGDTAGLVPKHCNKVVFIHFFFFLFPSAYMLTVHSSL